MTKAAIKERLEAFPRLYLGSLRCKRLGHWSRKWIVSRKTAITIEGYPRSGNSFAHSAFRIAQDREYRIATHVHSHAQILRSVQLGVPTMVLVREPRAACLSLVALHNEIAENNAAEVVFPLARRYLIDNLRRYRTFYERVLTARHGIVVAEFGRVTRDFGEIIRRVNQRFGTSFNEYRNTESSDADVFDRGGFHLSPSSQRDSIKASLDHCFEADDVRGLADSAADVHKRMLELEAEQTETLARSGG